MHGGDTPQGIASPHYRGKGYSRSIPTHLKDIYEAHHNDPDLLSLHKEIALCGTRIEDLLTQISGRMGDCIDQVSAAFSAFQKAHALPWMIPDRSSPSRVRFAASRPGPIRADPKEWLFMREKGGVGPCGRAEREPFGHTRRLILIGELPGARHRDRSR